MNDTLKDANGVFLRKEDERMQQYLQVAEVLKPQGVDGGVKIRVDMDSPEDLNGVKILYTKAGGAYEPVEVKKAEARGDFACLWLEGVDNRNLAEALRGTIYYMKRSDLKPLPDGAYYLADVPGLSLVDEQGQALGQVKQVMTLQSGNVFVVDTPKGEMLFPSVPHVVVRVAPQDGVLVVDKEKLDEVAVFAD